jgi:GNAT superfamily N-acetyltransferase
MRSVCPTLRPAALSDFDAIEALMYRSVRALCIRDYTAEQIAVMMRDFAFARAEEILIRDRTYFVAEFEGAIVGCGGWSWRAKTYRMRDDDTGQETALPHPAPGLAAIRAIFVEPALAGRGIGRTLVCAAEEAARKEGYGAFEIGATLTGVPLYRTLGYRASGLYSFELASGGRFAVVMMHKRNRRDDARDAGASGSGAMCRPKHLSADTAMGDTI